MRRLLLPIAVALAAAFACGDQDTALLSGDDDGGTDGSSGGIDGPLDDGGGIDATPAPYGMDTRPPNPTCTAKARPPTATGVKLQQMWTGINFNQPIYMTQAPGDADRFFVVSRLGKVQVLARNATAQTDLADVVSIAVNTNGEGGLLGFAFHPNWQTNHEAYLSYTRDVANGDPSFPPQCPGADHPFTSAVARFHSSDGGKTLDPTADEILRIGQPYSNHDGGNIQFGPDGMLYVGFGDGGSGNDPCGSGQDLTSKFGKMLRIDINAGVGAYNIPADNPFATDAVNEKAIWAYGLRNPWRWSFDKATGDLWVGDVGQDTWEEIDRVQKGGNYGWNVCEGAHKRGSATELCNTPGLIDPIVEHPRSEATSITGGYVYRGSAIPSLVGTYVYGDYGTGNVWALTYDAFNRPTPKLLMNVGGSTLVSFAQDNDGEIYTVQISGTLSKLVPDGTPPVDTFPKLLSQTGCVDPNDATKPASGLIPYDVVSPLWSDGAKKERYFALPDGKTIAVGTIFDGGAADGGVITSPEDWDLPIGSVVMKVFWVGNQRVETRLFMRHDDGDWAGYTYEWNDQGTDAALLPAGKVKPVAGGAQNWTYPSRTQCIQCHSRAAGGTIGLETWQLNKDMVYVQTARISNQLATLDNIGVFSSPIGTPGTLPRLAEPAGSDPLDRRARSYLHANCSHCHRPGGGGQGTMDLRFGQNFAQTGTCNADVTQGAVGAATKILFPGDPTKSAMSLRMHASDSKRMPPVAVSIVDPVGSKVIDDWITSTTTCP